MNKKKCPNPSNLLVDFCVLSATLNTLTVTLKLNKKAMIIGAMIMLFLWSSSGIFDSRVAFVLV